jgi:hypothetical protein
MVMCIVEMEVYNLQTREKRYCAIMAYATLASTDGVLHYRICETIRMKCETLTCFVCSVPRRVGERIAGQLQPNPSMNRTRLYTDT